METLDTDNWLRNRHLRSSKYFNNKEYPRLYFQSNSISRNGNEYIVKGTLTIKGISKEVTFLFQRSGTGYKGTAEINSADFDINIHKEHSQNAVAVTIFMAVK